MKKVKAPVRIDFGGGTTDISPFKDKYGGAVLNCAISRYVVGELVATDKKTHLEYTGDVPTSSGLGTSGVMNLVWLALISKTKDKKVLAENVYKLEQSQGLVGGKQDAYAAAFGGINLWEFKKDKVVKKKLNLKKDTIKKLEEGLVLVYMGEHYSGDSNNAMIESFRKGKNVKHLLKIKEIAYGMKIALEKGDVDEFAKLMNYETMEREKLHKSIVPKKTKKVIKKGLENGAVAVKVCGAGGGGSVLFFGDKKRLKKKFGNKVIDFKFDWKGLQGI